MCRALRYKGHMSMINQISGAEYAPDENRNIMFLPLMKKTSKRGHRGQTLASCNKTFYPTSSVMLQGRNVSKIKIDKLYLALKFNQMEDM